MEEYSQPTVSATFREQKKRNRRKQHHRHHAKSTERTANVKHREDFTGPKTLAQIKGEKDRSKLSSQPNAYMTNGRSFSNDFQGPKSLSELVKAKGMTYGGSQCRISRC
jgi:zinc finger CCCH domain-containing protein 11